MKKLLVLLFCFTTIFAQGVFDSYYADEDNETNRSIFMEVNKNDINASNTLAVKNNETNNSNVLEIENNETNSSEIVKEHGQSIFLSYEDTPSTIYVGEIFPIKIKAIIANDDFEDIANDFNNSQELEVINKDSKWAWSSDNVFYNTFYMKANMTSAKLPDLNLTIYQDSAKLETQQLEAISPNIIQLKGTQYFSGVIAKSLKVKKSKTTNFDDKNFIVVLEIEAELANLNDFSLSWVVRDGIDSSRDNLPYFSIFYYAIVPNYTQNFKFNFFNRTTNKFENITMPIVLSDDKISTQIDLNPAESSLQVYKDITYGFIALMFIILFIKKRKKVYLVLLILLVALLIYDKNPFNSMKIAKGSQIKILPTQKSTIFYTTNRTLYVQKLDTKNDYIKILLPNGKIGWIDDSKN